MNDRKAALAGPLVDEKRLAEIEARANAASVGPWTQDDVVGGKIFGPRVQEGELIADVRGWGFLTKILGLPPEEAGRVQFANGEFIAKSRTDVPDLVTEVRRLRGALQELLLAAEATGEDLSDRWLAEKLRAALGPERAPACANGSSCVQPGGCGNPEGRDWCSNCGAVLAGTQGRSYPSCQNCS